MNPGGIAACAMSAERRAELPVEPAALDSAESKPLIAHVVYRFDVGGLENGVVNLINCLPRERFRHAIIALTECTDFRLRIRRNDVDFYSLGMRPGFDFAAHLRLWSLLRRLRPSIVHTRNLAAMDGQIAAALAGVRRRVHGEHGRDVADLDGSNAKYQWERRLLQPLVRRFVPLSRDLERYLLETIRVPADKIVQIYNGVDLARFRPPANGRRGILPVSGFAGAQDFVIGTIGRMEAVKDQITLVRAFIHLGELRPEWRARLRLVLVGDGPLREASRALLESAGLADQAWLPGARQDASEILQALDVFVLPSLAEGISNTILEAMGCARPVVATRVGGNVELVLEAESGRLVPPGQPAALAHVLSDYLDNVDMRFDHGRAGRRRAERKFSLDTMVEKYLALYEEMLAS